MKAFTRIGILAGLIVLALLINPDVIRAQNYRGLCLADRMVARGIRQRNCA